MLDLLTRILDFGETEGCGGAFEEMAERGEFFEVFQFSSGGWYVSLNILVFREAGPPPCEAEMRLNGCD